MASYVLTCNSSHLNQYHIADFVIWGVEWDYKTVGTPSKRVGCGKGLDHTEGEGARKFPPCLEEEGGGRKGF